MRSESNTRNEGFLKQIFYSVFPPSYTKEAQERSMRPTVRKIVSCHALSLGDGSLVSGEYFTQKDQDRRHAEAVKAMKNW